MLAFQLGSPVAQGAGNTTPAPGFPPSPPVPDAIKHLTMALMPPLVMAQTPAPPTPTPPAPQPVFPGIAPTNPGTPPVPPTPPPMDVVVAPPPINMAPPPGPVLPGVTPMRQVPKWIWWTLGVVAVGTVAGVALSR